MRKLLSTLFALALSVAASAAAFGGSMTLLGVGKAPGGGACSGWTPATPSGLVAWYDADVGVTNTGDGTPATAWANQSGHGYTLTTLAGTSAPTYRAAGLGGKPFLQFSAGITAQTTGNVVAIGTGNVSSAYVLTSQTTSTNGQGVSYQAVGQAPGTGANSGVWFFFTTTPDFTWDHAFSTGTALAFTANTETRLGMILDGVNATPYKNGVAGTANALNFSWATGGAIILGSGSGGWDGQAREIIIYNTALGSTDQTCVDAYLVSRQ
jgi:hypothetical protein